MPHAHAVCLTCLMPAACTGDDIASSAVLALPRPARRHGVVGCGLRIRLSPHTTQYSKWKGHEGLSYPGRALTT